MSASLSFGALLNLQHTDASGVFTTVVDDSWGIAKAINGGVLMSIAARALEVRAADEGLQPHVVALSSVFLSRSTPGTLRVETELLRRGRGVSAAEVRITQDEDGATVDRFRALLTLSDLAAHAEPVLLQPSPPPMPAPQECVGTPDTARLRGETEVPLAEHIEQRLDPATAGWARGEPSGQGEIRGWFRFLDDRAVQPADLYFVLDCFPPVAFDLGLMGWAPTLSFTGYTRGIPAPGWIQVRMRTSTAIGGLIEEDVELWDSTGQLVAQSRQLAGIRPPKG